MLSYAVIICTLEWRKTLDDCLHSLIGQTPWAKEIILVHGGQNVDEMETRLRNILSSSTIQPIIIASKPSLVRQRNAGIEAATGDVIFFFDDDVVLSFNYIQEVLAVYEDDKARELGGVQGTAIQVPLTSLFVSMVQRIFLMSTFSGDGRMQRSGYPAFLGPCHRPTEVEVFSGCMMSFRRQVLQDIRFDEALIEYWYGDDIDISFRISRRYKLIQIPSATLVHRSRPYEGARRCDLAWRKRANRLYLFRKHLNPGAFDWICYAWAELGEFFYSLALMVAGRGPDHFLGIVGGYRDLIVSKGNHPGTNELNR
jgi:glycosyltransferase involved in cell wall biosynthesis